MSVGILIAHWRDVFHCSSPEAWIGGVIANEGGEDVYDVLAAQRAYRQSIEQALPSGFCLKGNEFYGPSDGFQYSGGRWETGDRHNPREIFQGVLETAAGLAEGCEGDDYFGQTHFRRIAEPYRITESTTSVLYATWQQVTGGESVEVTVRSALDAFAYAHVESLASSGRYDWETLNHACSGKFATADRIREVAPAYQEAIDALLPQEGIVLKVDGFYGPPPRRTGIDFHAAVKAVDLGKIIAQRMVGESRKA